MINYVQCDVKTKKVSTSEIPRLHVQQCRAKCSVSVPAPQEEYNQAV